MRVMNIYIPLEKLFFPQQFVFALKQLPQWSPSESERGTHCLFPSVREFSIEKIATIQDNLWRYLCVHVFANTITARLIGDIGPQRDFGTQKNEDGSPERPMDNFKEEGRCEEVVHTLVANLKRLHLIDLTDAWKRHWIAPAGVSRDPPSGYLFKKKKFINDLAARGICVMNYLELWDTYRGFGGFASVDGENDTLNG